MDIVYPLVILFRDIDYGRWVVQPQLIKLVLRLLESMSHSAHQLIGLWVNLLAIIPVAVVLSDMMDKGGDKAERVMVRLSQEPIFCQVLSPPDVWILSLKLSDLVLNATGIDM
jgi:hypothetical protein